MSFSRSPRPKFQNHLVFITFHNRIFVVFVFDKISKGMLGEYFQRLHFWNQWIPLIKMHCNVCYLFDYDLKICSVYKYLNHFLEDWKIFNSTSKGSTRICRLIGYVGSTYSLRTLPFSFEVLGDCSFHLWKWARLWWQNKRVRFYFSPDPKV